MSFESTSLSGELSLLESDGKYKGESSSLHKRSLVSFSTGTPSSTCEHSYITLKRNKNTFPYTQVRPPYMHILNAFLTKINKSAVTILFTYPIKNTS